jgi:ankyrin repeat protein
MSNLDANFKLWGASPLVIAAGMGHEAVVQLLMQKKDLDIDPKDNMDYNTPLLGATHGEYTSIVRLLLTNQDIGINLQDSHNSALPWAVVHHHNDIVRLLLENGADSNARGGPGRHGYTALIQAVYYDNHTALSLLLKYGATINSESCYRRRHKSKTALSLAAAKGDEAIVCFLLEEGADFHSALHLAALRDHESTVRLLLEEGANIHSVALNGKSALHLAALNGYEATVRLLLEYGADIQMRYRNGETALDMVQKWIVKVRTIGIGPKIKCT